MELATEHKSFRIKSSVYNVVTFLQFFHIFFLFVRLWKLSRWNVAIVVLVFPECAFPVTLSKFYIICATSFVAMFLLLFSVFIVFCVVKLTFYCRYSVHDNVWIYALQNVCVSSFFFFSHRSGLIYSSPS